MLRTKVYVEAYSPIGHGKILDNPQIKAIAEKYGVSVLNSASDTHCNSAYSLCRKQQIRIT